MTDCLHGEIQLLPGRGARCGVCRAVALFLDPQPDTAPVMCKCGFGPPHPAEQRPRPDLSGPEWAPATTPHVTLTAADYDALVALARPAPDTALREAAVHAANILDACGTIYDHPGCTEQAVALRAALEAER